LRWGSWGGKSVGVQRRHAWAASVSEGDSWRDCGSRLLLPVPSELRGRCGPLLVNKSGSGGWGGR